MKLKHFKNFVQRIVLTAGLLISVNGLYINQASAISTNTRVTYPTAIVLELGGRGILYSLNFDRVLTEDFSFGIGVGTVQANFPNGTTADKSTAIIPAYFTYYIWRDAGSFFGTLGANLIPNASSVQGLTTSTGGVELNNNPIQGTAGIGYEMRSDTGFLFRITGYGILASSFAPWAGLSVGYSF